MSIRRTAAACAVGLGLGALSLSASPSPAHADPLPPTAVALGDSFISGEGAGELQRRDRPERRQQGFPGWAADNNNAYFCHRSANASLLQADAARHRRTGSTSLAPAASRSTSPTTSAARNKGAHRRRAARPAPRGRADPRHRSGAGRARLQQQLLHLRRRGDACAPTGSSPTRGPAGGRSGPTSTARYRAGARAPTPTWRPPRSSPPPPPRRPPRCASCSTTLDEVDADGQHRVVFQDYTNPLPPDDDARTITEDGRADDRDKFRALGDERYAAGCPAHRASLGPGHQLLGQASARSCRRAHATLSRRVPGRGPRLPQRAARLRRRPAVREGRGARPTRWPRRSGCMDGPTGVFVTSLYGIRQDRHPAASPTPASTYYQTCQESWHPNAAGHEVLGQCLTGAWTQGPSC